jgi:predicted RNA binding protein YcfA (HicA-like mRNA interferase family)
VAKLPAGVSGNQLRRALERAGFVLTRQRGSHMILNRHSPPARVVVPNHKALKPGTLRSILDDADLSAEDLIRLL